MADPGRHRRLQLSPDRGAETVQGDDAARLETIAPGGEFVVVLPDGSRHRIVQLT